MELLRLFEPRTFRKAGRKGKVGFNGIGIPFRLPAFRTPFGVKELRFQDEELGLLGVMADRPIVHEVVQGLGCALVFARGVIELGALPSLGFQLSPELRDHGIAGVPLVRLRVAVQKQLEVVHRRAGVALVEVGLGGKPVAAERRLVLGLFRAVGGRESLGEVPHGVAGHVPVLDAEVGFGVHVVHVFHALRAAEQSNEFLQERQGLHAAVVGKVFLGPGPLQLRIGALQHLLVIATAGGQRQQAQADRHEKEGRTNGAQGGHRGENSGRRRTPQGVLHREVPTLVAQSDGVKNACNTFAPSISQRNTYVLDIFDRIRNNRGPLGQHAKETHGYFTFPKLEGDISNRMTFRGKEVLVWSINNYLGLANHPEVRAVDAEAAKEWGMGYPMGARIMSGQTALHEKLEQNLAEFMQKEDAFLLNYGYQGCQSAIEALVSRHDVIVYDSESHACMIDGVRLHQGKRFVFNHNDMESFVKQLDRARNLTEQTGGGILVVTEGVFGMAGDQGKLAEIVKYKKEYGFRLFVDDAHGFGTVGENGRGAGDEQGCHDEIDVYFGTFAKAMATIGAFVAGPQDVIDYLRYNMRSQTFAKSLPMPLVVGALKRLEMMATQPEHKENLWKVASALQKGLRDAGFDIGDTNSCVTPVFLKGGLGEATNLTFDLRENYGIFCSIVVYPVVPKDVIMLRLIPTAVHTLEDVTYTIDTFKKVQERLQAGEYVGEGITDWA